MIFFMLNDGSKVSLDDMAEIYMVVPQDRVMNYFWEEACASFDSVYVDYGKHFMTNEVDVLFTRNRRIGDAEPILIEGDAYEQDAEG